MATTLPIFVHRPHYRAGRGFTLIEAALATLIIGVGVVAVMELFFACTRQNRYGTQQTTAMFLANNIRETMAALSFNDPITASTAFGAESGEMLATYDDVDDFDAGRFGPPIDATRATIPELAAYTQEVSVVPVYPTKLSANPNDSPTDIPRTTYTGAVRVQVKVLYRAIPSDPPQEVYRASWVRVDG